MPILFADLHWTAYLSALSVPMIALFGAIIAWRQTRTARERLKLDLFDRRFAQYDAARQLVVKTLIWRVSDEDIDRYGIKAREAKWLINAKVARYLENELPDKLYRLHVLIKAAEGDLDNESRKENTEAQDEIRDWLRLQFRVIDNLFAPFLDLRR